MSKLIDLIKEIQISSIPKYFQEGDGGWITWTDYGFNKMKSIKNSKEAIDEFLELLAQKSGIDQGVLNTKDYSVDKINREYHKYISSLKLNEIQIQAFPKYFKNRSDGTVTWTDLGIDWLHGTFNSDEIADSFWKVFAKKYNTSRWNLHLERYPIDEINREFNKYLASLK